MTNPCVWFEIPVTDIKRAMAFYTTVLQIEMEVTEMKATGMATTQMAMFPMDPENHTGAGSLIQSDLYKPSPDGAVIYLSAGEDLTPALNRIESAGGKIIKGKSSIDEHGYVAFFNDTEGNRVALHSQN